LEQVTKYLPENSKVYIAKDVPNISKAKNECLEALKDCEHIFLFDDDCFPIAKDWHVPFIESGLNHLLYMKPHHGISSNKGVYTVFTECSGVFMYLTKEVVDKVGYFGNYGRYGFEHAGYTHRIYKAGLTPSKYMTLNGTEKLIHSLDLDGAFNGIEAKPSLSVDEVKNSLQINKIVYAKEITD
jgi:hypothetical protein